MGLIRHPVVVFGIAWAVLLALAAFRRGTEPHLRGRRELTLGASLAAIAAYCAIVIWYTLTPSYFDAAEPTITSVAAAFAAGRPLYPALGAAERYAHVYGPALFLAHAGAFAVAGASILVSKAVGSLAAVLSLAIAFRIYQRRAGTSAACNVSAVSALVFLSFSNVTFWTRSDPILILCTSIGLAAALTERPWVAMSALGLATGVALNLKVTGVIYLVPVFAIASSKHRGRVVATAAGIAIVTGVVPFLVPRVSLFNYLDYLRLSARNGLLTAKLVENAEWCVFLLLPLLVTWMGIRNTRLQRETGRFLACLVSAIGLIAIVSAKPGGGAFHFLPFVPILGYAAIAVPRGTWDRSAALRLAAAFVMTALAIAIPRQAIFVRTVAKRHLGRAIADVRRFADEKPTKRIAVGYAGTSYLSHARPEMVFRSGDYLIDAPAIQEHRLSGLDIPATTIEAIDRCRFDYWLLPPDAPPFAVPSAYYPLGPSEVFTEQFRSAFSGRYARVGHTALYDVWECRGQTRGAAK